MFDKISIYKVLSVREIISYCAMNPQAFVTGLV